MGENPIRDESKFQWLTFETFCFCCSLGAGTLILGILFTICGVLWIVGSVVEGGYGFISLLSGILSLIIGILILVGYQKQNVELLWWSVYILIIDVIWLIISAVILFVFLLPVHGIFSLLNAFIILLCACVIRSYAFQMDSSPVISKA